MAGTLGGEAHFFEESMNATKVRVAVLIGLLVDTHSRIEWLMGKGIDWGGPSHLSPPPPFPFTVAGALLPGVQQGVGEVARHEVPPGQHEQR